MAETKKLENEANKEINALNEEYKILDLERRDVKEVHDRVKYEMEMKQKTIMDDHKKSNDMLYSFF